MNRNQIVAFIKLLSATNIQHGDNWVRCSCILSPWTHEKGSDNSPSFAIHVNEQGDSFYNCYACGSGDLFYLLEQLSSYKAAPPKYNIKNAVSLLVDVHNKLTGLTLCINDNVEPKLPTVALFTEDWLNSFPLADKVPQAVAYLESRHVPRQRIQELGVRYDYSKNIVAFPMRGKSGELLGLHGRRMTPINDEPRYHVYKNPEGEHNGKITWHGLDTVDDNYPVIMVESVFDKMSLDRVFRNVVAPLSTGISKVKIKPMINALDVVTLFDHGMGGDFARTAITKYMKDSLITHITPPTGKDGGDLTIPEIKELFSNCIGLLTNPSN